MTDNQATAGPLISGIPLAVWAAIAAAVLGPVATLIGVVLSNRNLRKNVRKQLAHDASQRDIERKMALRREVYLEAAAALSHLTQVLGQVSNLGHDLNALSGAFADDLAKLAKIQMVGTEETVEAVMTYINAVGPAFMELLMLRTPMMLQQNKIDAETDPDTKALLGRQQLSASFAASERGLELALETAKLLPNAVIAVRKEMDLPLDRKLLESLWEVQFQRMQEVWVRAKAQLESLTGK